MFFLFVFVLLFHQQNSTIQNKKCVLKKCETFNTKAGNENIVCEKLQKHFEISCIKGNISITTLKHQMQCKKRGVALRSSFPRFFSNKKKIHTRSQKQNTKEIHKRLGNTKLNTLHSNTKKTWK